MSRIERLSDDVTLYLGDCRDVLPTLGLIEAIVTDPPYGIGENDKKVASRGKLAVPIDYGAFDWDEEPIDADTVALLRARSIWQIIFGGNYFELPPTSCWLIWDKENGTNDFADCELAWTNLRKAVRRIYWRWNGMIRRGDDVRLHPTQKPVGVMRWCLEQLPESTKTICNPFMGSGTICDPFMGSGTTGVAAVSLGLSFTGIEREPKYFDIACRRISDELSRPRLALDEPIKPIQEVMAI